MNVSYNPIQYQLQLFGVNGAQTGANLNATNSDPFGMAISAVGATVVPEVQNADGSGGSTTGDNSYRSWAQSLQSYNQAAQSGSQAPADSDGTAQVSSGTDDGQSSAPAASGGTDGESSASGTNGDTETTASSTTTTAASNGSASTGSPGNSSSGQYNGGLLGLFRR